MKILVVSDTHHMISNAVNLINKLKPDYVFHLGDVCDDCRQLEELFPSVIIVSVKGNNDYFDKTYPDERFFELGGKKIFMCHGHKYNVKMSMLPITYKAKELGADIVLYGHTHRAFLDNTDEMIILNPGSVGSYAIIDITEDNAEVKLEKYAE